MNNWMSTFHRLVVQAFNKVEAQMISDQKNQSEFRDGINSEIDDINDSQNSILEIIYDKFS